ncbi:MAG: ATP-dependent helicase [Pirellulaceae bacterium]|nr:ATP-dependent helicase [Pirellulaceae bacterium]
MGILEGLNPEQQAAAAHGDSPLLIIAGAGSGKTTTLVHRVAHLIDQGISPQRIMLLTYTRRAAMMMTERTRKLVGESADLSGIWSGTFHGTSVRLLRLFSQAIGLPSHFTVHDRSDSEDMLDAMLKKLTDKQGDKTLPKKGTALSIHSYQVNSQWPLERVIEEQYGDFTKHIDTLRHLFANYQKQKRTLGIADFDDLLLLMRDMVHHPQIGPRIVEKFQAVLVDEYQDTNVLQSQILAGLSPRGRGLTVVGDDAQSIYSFRAATVRNILDFPLQYPDTHVVKLEKNYRSTVPLLNVSNALIDQAKERFEKRLWSDRTSGARPQLVSCFSESEQAEFIVQRILRHKFEGIPIKDQAVLFRAGHHSLMLETDLMRNKINFVKYGGLKFAEAAHVKDLLAFLRLAENPKDSVAVLRVLLLIPGIGARRAAQALDMLDASTTGLEIWHQLKPSAAAAGMWPKMIKMISGLAAGHPAALQAQLACVLEFYQPLMEERYDNASQRLSDLQQLMAMADRFESRQQMLTDLTLDPPTSTEDLPDLDEVRGKRAKKPKEPPLVLSTIHSAKGLEWPVVYVMSAMGGCIPMPRAIGTSEGYEEERRLLYVALTRAADYLYVTYKEAGMGDDFGFGYRRSYGNPTGGLCEYLEPKPIRKLFQSQDASHWREIESIGETPLETEKQAKSRVPKPKMPAKRKRPADG